MISLFIYKIAGPKSHRLYIYALYMKFTSYSVMQPGIYYMNVLNASNGPVSQYYTWMRNLFMKMANNLLVVIGQCGN